jgi:hypothetical protein
MNRADFAVGIWGENGQGIASTGDILARIFARRGSHLNAYQWFNPRIRLLEDQGHDPTDFHPTQHASPAARDLRALSR